MSPRVFFDANVLLDAALVRQNKLAADETLKTHSGSACISALTAHLVVHFAKVELDMKILQTFLRDFTVLSLEQTDFDWALTNMRDNDFEDALQLSIAIRHGCEKFITFDRTLYERYENLPTINVELIR